MSATETATEQAAIEALLAEHMLHPSMNICIGRLTPTVNCGWRAVPNAGSLLDQHRAHVAAVIAQQRAADTGDRETLARADLTERDYRVAATAFRETAEAMLSEQRHIRDEYLPGWNTAVHRILGRARTLNGHADRVRAALAGEPRRDDGQGAAA